MGWSRQPCLHSGRALLSIRSLLALETSNAKELPLSPERSSCPRSAPDAAGVLGRPCAAACGGRRAATGQRASGAGAAILPRGEHHRDRAGGLSTRFVARDPSRRLRIRSARPAAGPEVARPELGTPAPAGGRPAWAGPERGPQRITRCNKTIASDGIADGVDFDATDLFCLDGNKLVLTSGTYGQDGSEYRTEHDTFAKIKASGDQAGGPQHFRVWTKDLRILDTMRSRRHGWRGSPVSHSVAVQGAVRYRWLLRDVQDRSGNGIRYHYSVEQEQAMPFSLEVRPSLIGNPGASGKPGAPVPEYQPRPDTGFWYEAGVRTRSTQRLSRIRMYARIRSPPKRCGRMP